MTIPFCDATTCPSAGCTPVVCRGAGMPSNSAVFERSARVIPGGVNSSIRAFKSVGGMPYVVARAEGAWVHDVEGRDEAGGGDIAPENPEQGRQVHPPGV